MFATQPKLFNPVETHDRTDEIIFAGSWYAQHPARCVEMENVFDTILQSSNLLKIYNRHSENDDPNHMFPDKYLPYIHPRLSHDQLDEAYKGSKYALNFNTVTESDTMFARRIFEVMSSNTLVVSNYSRGVGRLFGDNVVFIDGTTPPDLSDEDAKREYCLYSVLQHHTYKHRFEQILQDIGMAYQEDIPIVTFRYQVDGINSAIEAVRHFYSMDWDNKKCVLVVDESCQIGELQDIVCRFNVGAVTVYSSHYENTYKSKINVATFGYVINATTGISCDFVRKALAHTCYLDDDIVIIAGSDKFKFSEAKQGLNMLMPVDCLKSEVVTIFVV